MSDLLTAQEVADYFKVHINTVYNWINSGQLKAVKAGDLWRVSRTELDEFPKDRETIGKGG